MASSGDSRALVLSTKTPSNLASSSALAWSMAKWPWSGFIKPAIALVADQRLVALLQLPFERGQDRSPGGGILPHLVVVAADDVAPPGERHRLGLVVDLLFAFGQKERDEGRGIVEHEFAHELVAALAHAQNVEQLAGQG